MTVLITAFLEHIAPYVLTVGAALITLIGYGFHQRLAGAKAEREKQAAAEAKAASEGQKIDDAVAGRTPDDNRARLDKWSRS